MPQITIDKDKFLFYKNSINTFMQMKIGMQSTFLIRFFCLEQDFSNLVAWLDFVYLYRVIQV